MERAGIEMESGTTNTLTGPQAAKDSPFGSFALALSGIPITLSGGSLMVVMVAVHGHSRALFNVSVVWIVAGGLLSALGGYVAGLARQPKDNEEA